MQKEKFDKRFIPGELQSEFEKYVKVNIPVKRLESLIMSCIKLGASDIHIEPQVYEKEDLEKKLMVLVRVRIGGSLEFYNDISNNMDGMILMGEDYENYVRGIKMFLNLSGSDGTIPLDTGYSIKEGDVDVNLRFNFLPEGIPLENSQGFHPKIVIRILNNKQSIVNLNTIGLLKNDENKIMKFLGQKQGLLIMAGPTGSGKTTTLYSMLHEINKPGVNIQTIEDPIEYRIPGLNQSKINYKSSIPYTFALALRAILRQDPDIIMVGETRDIETGKIAIEASNTGHLVLTTIHANSSIDIFLRLIQMGIEKYQVVNGVNLGFSQRLQKRVCTHCGIKHKYTQDYVEEFKKEFNGFDFGNFTKEDFIRIFLNKIQDASAQGIVNSFINLKNKINEIEDKLIEDKFNDTLLGEKEKALAQYRSNNNKIFDKIIFNIEKSATFLKANIDSNNKCEHCLGKGYKGRIPIFEIVENNEELGELLLKDASKRELHKFIEKNSIFTLKKYSYLLLIEGIIDYNEYLSVNT